MTATGATRSPLDAEDLRVRVQKRLDDFLATQVPLLDEVSPDLAPLSESIIDLLRGGKRLRPAFAYWGWRAVATGDPEPLSLIHI